MCLNESRQIQLIDRLTDEKIFHRPNLTDFAAFQKYRNKIIYGDLSFTSCYLWENSMHYRVRITPHAIFILGLGADHETGVYVLFNDDVPAITNEITILKNIFDSAQIPLRLECVSEADVGRICKLPFVCEVSYNDDYSDYIYDNADFTDMRGTQNKNKRHEYQRFVQRYPDAILVPGHLSDSAFRRDCQAIFDRWCTQHSCGECRFGCEKNAFERLCEIEMPERHLLGIVYDKDQPLSFGFGELLSDECVYFHMQKNAFPIEGLTYFLHSRMALQMHPTVKYINWAEDMGMEGIRRNKSKYHPIELRKKYSVLIRA